MASSLIQNSSQQTMGKYHGNKLRESSCKKVVEWDDKSGVHRKTHKFMFNSRCTLWNYLNYLRKKSLSFEVAAFFVLFKGWGKREKKHKRINEILKSK